jgi:predicted phage tail protein
VYLNDTPLNNTDGTANFTVRQLDYRPGAVDQTYITGFDSTANEVGVGVELKASVPWVHTVTNLTLSALRVTLSVSSLSKTDANSGDVSGYQVAYQVQLSIDGGAFNTVVDTSFNGKASSVYQRSHRIELTGAASQYAVKVIRLTADTSDVYIQDTTNVVSYTELTDAKLRYPMSALCGLQIDASEFSSVPTRSYDMKGLLIKYPSNYNPTTRTYAGTWDGTFTTGWTDNPAWVFYDLVLNTRYGMGRWVDASMIDRYSLYQIAQYCDVSVSNGKDGTEPRFTCNCYIASRADAFKVLQDLASVFRGMAYWTAGQVAATCDMPMDPAYVYTAANVIGGQFKYVGSSLKTRYTCALVTWNDPDNAYAQAVEYVEDSDGVARYGLNKAEVTAFACTSRAQAQRVGQWTLLTSRYETNTVTFSVGLDGTLCQPGQIIAVADPARAGRRTGGRIKAVTSGSKVTLDSVPTVAVGDTLTLVMPNGVASSSTVSAVSGALITVSPAFSTAPQAGSVWMLESATLKSQLFRVASVAEKDGISFEVTATQHEPGKYAAIDNGAAIDVRPITGNTLTVQSAPASVTVSQYVVVDQGTAKTNMTISWSAAPNAVKYTVQWRKDNGDWITAGVTGGLSMDITGIYSGSYTARVKATNGLDISSVYTYSSLTALTGKTGAPPTVASLTASTDKVFAVDVTWSFPSTAGDTDYAELYYSHTASFSSATLQGRYSYPTTKATLLGLAAGYDLYFWIRLVDTTGNVGAWFPASTGAGAHGQSSADAAAILAYLTGQITQTQLGQDVLGPVQAVAGLQTSVSANAAAITKEITDRTTAIANEAAARGAAVTAETTARQAADTSLGQRIDTVTASVNSNASAIQAEQTARANGDSANATAITALTSTVGTKTTTFRQSITPIAQAVGDTWVDTGSTNLIRWSQDLSQSVWSKQASGTGVAPVVTGNYAAAPDGTATASRVVFNRGTGTASTDYSRISENVTTVTGQPYTISVWARSSDGTSTYKLQMSLNGANATVITVGPTWTRYSVVLAAASDTSRIFRFDTQGSASTTSQTADILLWGAQHEQQAGMGRYIPTTSASASTVGNNALLVWDGSVWQLSQDAAIPANTAAIASEASTRATADSALSTRIDTLTSTVSGNTAAITAEQTTRASADSALSDRLTTVEATYVTPPMAGDPSGYAGSPTVYAGVYSEQSARAEADLALSIKTDTVQAQISTSSANLTAMVNTETTARVTGDAANASAITTVQANLNDTNAAVQTNATAYANLNGQLSASYTIKTQITTGGRTYIAGIGVGIDNTSGTVESQVLVAAQKFAILDNTGSAVSSPFIVSGGQVFMSSAFIQDASITNAKISGVIQSNSVGANGQPRWVLDKNGVFTMNGANSGSGYLTITDSLVSVYDGNGVLRVRLGLW